MPAVSERQRIAMAIAEHTPDKLDKKNAGMLKMSQRQLHEYAKRVGRKKKAKHGKGTKANPYSVGLGQAIPKGGKKLGEPR